MWAVEFVTSLISVVLNVQFVDHLGDIQPYVAEVT